MRRAPRWRSLKGLPDDPEGPQSPGGLESRTGAPLSSRPAIEGFPLPETPFTVKPPVWAKNPHLRQTCAPNNDPEGHRQMCGIVGAIAERNVVPILMEGLRRLEYRGYDSAGIAVLNGTAHLKRLRTVGKVKMLQDAIDADPTHGKVGIAHTRWATHGVPSERNAHPHVSHDGLAIVHNGIIENHEELRAELKKLGYTFTSETDTEVIAHRVHHHLKSQHDLFKAVRATVAELEGAYALALVSESEPERIILAREGCPVVIGLGVDENCVASDVAEALPGTRRFMFLEEGDVADIRRTSIKVLDKNGDTASRSVRESELSAEAAEKGQ